jgi:hypothetical protein
MNAGAHEHGMPYSMLQWGALPGRADAGALCALGRARAGLRQSSIKLNRKMLSNFGSDARHVRVDAV